MRTYAAIARKRIIAKIDKSSQNAGTAMTIRIAAFNAQNLFARPKVFTQSDRAIGATLLGRIAAFQKILDQTAYSNADKRNLVRAFNGTGNTPDTRPLSQFMQVREDRSRLWQRRGRGVIGVKASGRSDWDGVVEFKRAKFTETGRENTAKVLKSLRADVVCVVEVDNRLVLQQFDSQMLRSRYRFEMLMDGNDQRGIDLGVYSKFPFGDMRTHMFDGTSRSKTFSRDCPEYELVLPGGQKLTLLCNHLKSKGFGSQQSNDRRRKRQAEAIRDILATYDLRNDLVVVAGDLNDTPDSAPLKPLMDVPHLHDVLALQFPNAPKKRWTYHFNSFEQIDYLLVSKPLREKFVEAGVERRGMHKLARLTSRDPDVDTEQEFDTVTSKSNSGSDHGAVWADFNL